VAKCRRQQAKDYALMLKNLDRQKVRWEGKKTDGPRSHTTHTHPSSSFQDIAMVLSGERAPQRELVKMAAARCGLSVPDAPSQEGISMEDGAKRGYTALRQTWRPDIKSEITKKYSGRVEKRIGKDKDDEK
jgi:hypothetical protein